MLLRNALYLKELRVGVPVGVRLKGMTSEMHSSNLPMPASDWKKDRELKISEDCSEHSEKSIIKGNSIESVEIEEIRSNPDKLDSMTVKELRTMTRSVGLSTSGNKQELISSLKFLLFKGKTTISEDVSDNKQKQTKKRKQMVESSIAEDDSKCVL
ncbi:DNA-(apurinic or apyrimidinic site) lyase, chloroplastic-like, partial [Phalaenopsis equestris]|uniref:DNA-(apurinic or apyrimidinic site) lyase, chloroplastic-like n=1 Tax=Phalaenopsis equestris TaxID=78828 RepID=UPI0009E5AEB1